MREPRSILSNLNNGIRINLRHLMKKKLMSTICAELLQIHDHLLRGCVHITTPKTNKMKVVIETLLICSLLFGALNEVDSFPTGAGGCAGGMAAVGGSHLGQSDGRVVSNSTLETGGVTVQIGNITLENNAPLDLTTIEDHTITIISTEFPIRGILIRVEADGADTDRKSVV